MCIQPIVLAFRDFHLRFRAALLRAGQGRRSGAGKGFLRGGDTARPPGFSWRFRSERGKCRGPSRSWYPHFGPSPGAGARRSGLPLEAAPPRSWWQLWGIARGASTRDSRMPRALQTSQPWNRQPTKCRVRFAGTPAVQRLRARAVEPGARVPGLTPTGRPETLGKFSDLTFLVCKM